MDAQLIAATDSRLAGRVWTALVVALGLAAGAVAAWVFASPARAIIIGERVDPSQPVHIVATASSCPSRAPVHEAVPQPTVERRVAIRTLPVEPVRTVETTTPARMPTDAPVSEGLTGVVVANGRAIPAATIELLHTGGSLHAVANAAGRFTFSQRGHSLIVRANGFAPARVRVPATGEAVVELHAGHALRVTVLDPAGQPVPDARIATEVVDDVRTDATGTAVLLHLPAGPLALTAIADGLAGTASAIASRATDLTIRCTPLTAFDLLVLDANDRPVDGTSATLNRPGIRTALRPAGSGRFAASDLAAGAWQLAIDSPALGEWTGEVTIPADSEHTVRLAPARIAGHVRRGSQPVAGATVRARIPLGNSATTDALATTAVDGSFTLDADCAVTGNLAVIVSAPGMQPWSADVAAGCEDLQVVLRDAPTAHVQLVARNGAASLAGTATFIRDGHLAERLVVPATGRFRWPVLESGEWTLVVASPAGSFRGQVVAPVDTQTDRTLLLSPAASLEVRVVDAAGRAVAGAPLMIVSDELPGAATNATTDEHGRARIAGLPGGHWIVLAAAADGSLPVRQPVLVANGGHGSVTVTLAVGSP